MKLRFLILLIGLALGAVTASAHHSFSSEFNENEQVKLSGTVTKLELVNPHVWVYIDVMNPNGTVTSWAIEGGTPNAILRRGLRKEDFPIGAKVTVEGYRAKNGSNMASGRTVTFQDGRNFFLGLPGGPKDGAEK